MDKKIFIYNIHAYVHAELSYIYLIESEDKKMNFTMIFFLICNT